MHEIIMKIGRWQERRFYRFAPGDWREESPLGATPVGVPEPQAQLFDSFSAMVRTVKMLQAFGWRIHKQYRG